MIICTPQIRKAKKTLINSKMNPSHYYSAPLTFIKITKITNNPNQQKQGNTPNTNFFCLYIDHQ